MTTATTDLKAERARLALDLADGVEGAAEALAEVEARIATAKRDAERAAAAEGERSRRLEAEAIARAEAARAAAQAKMPGLAQKSAERGDTIGRLLGELRSELAAFRALDAEMVITARAAGLQMSEHRSLGLKARVLGEIAKVFPGNTDYHFPNPTQETFGEYHRRSLGLLGATNTPSIDETPAPAEAE